MKTLSGDDLETLMKISPKLSALNHHRYQTFHILFYKKMKHLSDYNRAPDGIIPFFELGCMLL